MNPQRSSVNALVKLGSFLVDGIVALVVVAYFVTRLGGEAYGIIPWLTSLFVFFTIIPTAVQTAAGRFVTHAIGRNDLSEGNQYFASSFYILIGLGAVGFLITIALAAFAGKLFPITPQYLGDGQILTLLLGATVCLDIARSGLAVAYFSRRRFDLEYIVMIASSLVRLVLIIALSEILGPSLIWIGIGMLAGALIRTAWGWYFSRKLLPGFSLSLRSWRQAKLRPLLIFALDVLIAGVGLTILNQADILIAGWLLGPAAVTMYFCGARWGLFFRAGIGAFTTVLVPQFTMSQAEGKLDDLRALVVRAERLVMPFGWLLAALLFAFAEPLIETWVGPDQLAAAGVLQIMAFPMAVTVNAYVIVSLLMGIGKIRESSLSALAIAVINPVLSIIAVLKLNLGIEGIALASALCLVGRNGLYLPRLAKRHANLSILDYYRRMIIATASSLPSLVFGIWIAEYFYPVGWIPLALGTFVCSVPSLVILFFLIASREDRRFLRGLLPPYRRP